MQMTKFQHKFYALSLGLMELIPLPENEEDFLTAYSTQTIVWKYMLGRSLRAKTSFPIDAEKHLESKHYHDAREEISLTLLEEIVEVQRIFLLLISEDNDGQVAFTEVLLRHWIGLIEELAGSEEAAAVLGLAGKYFDALLRIHSDNEANFSVEDIDSYPFEKASKEKTSAELTEALENLRETLRSDQN